MSLSAPFILYVENDNDDAVLTQRAFKKAGVTVRSASSKTANRPWLICTRKVAPAIGGSIRHMLQAAPFESPACLRARTGAG